MYFLGIVDTGTRNCIILQELHKHNKNSISPQVMDLLNDMTANADIIGKQGVQGIEAVITSFINFSENNTNKWQEHPPTFADKFLSNNFPCKLT